MDEGCRSHLVLLVEYLAKSCRQVLGAVSRLALANARIHFCRVAADRRAGGGFLLQVRGKSSARDLRRSEIMRRSNAPNGSGWVSGGSRQPCVSSSPAAVACFIIQANVMSESPRTIVKDEEAISVLDAPIEANAK